MSGEVQAAARLGEARKAGKAIKRTLFGAKPFVRLRNQELSGFRGIIQKTMRRKRLQHVADTMCQMFCGWRLISSKPNLVKLGSGALEIDAITGECLFQGKTLAQLTIAEEIRAWMRHELATNNVPIAALTGARLAVNLTFSVVPWSEPSRGIFYSGGKALRTNKMNRCILKCSSTVTTILLALWDWQGRPISGYILAHQDGRRANLDNLSKRTIVPALTRCAVCQQAQGTEHEGHDFRRDEKASIAWHGWYSLRRFHGTQVRHESGNSEVMSKALGNSKKVADRHYLKCTEVLPEVRKAVNDAMRGLIQ